MSFALQKRTGQVWTQEPMLAPEFCVDAANHNVGFSAGSTGIEWATRIPAVTIRRIDGGAPMIDPHTGSFLPRDVLDVQQLHIGGMHAHRDQFVVQHVRCDYNGPAKYHKSTQGSYRLTLILQNTNGGRPHLPAGGVYDIELYLDVSEVGGTRPYRVVAESGRMNTFSQALQSTQWECVFDFMGSSFPERNTHLKPKPLQTTKIHGTDEDAFVRTIEVEDSPFVPVRRTIKRPNLGIPKN